MKKLLLLIGLTLTLSAESQCLQAMKTSNVFMKRYLALTYSPYLKAGDSKIKQYQPSLRGNYSI